MPSAIKSARSCRLHLGKVTYASVQRIRGVLQSGNGSNDRADCRDHSPGDLGRARLSVPLSKEKKIAVVVARFDEDARIRRSTRRGLSTDLSIADSNSLPFHLWPKLPIEETS